MCNKELWVSLGKKNPKPMELLPQNFASILFKHLLQYYKLELKTQSISEAFKNVYFTLKIVVSLKLISYDLYL